MDLANVGLFGCIGLFNFGPIGRPSSFPLSISVPKMRGIFGIGDCFGVDPKRRGSIGDRKFMAAADVVVVAPLDIKLPVFFYRSMNFVRRLF